MHFALPAVQGLVLGIVAAAAGLIMLAFPQILSYVAGLSLITAGAIWISGGAWFPGIVSIFVGLILLVFRHFLSYLVGVYLIILSLWFIFAAGNMVIGLITVGIGVSVLFFPDILSYIYGSYLLLAGFIAAGHYFHWF
jgi:hypothetical protein